MGLLTPAALAASGLPYAFPSGPYTTTPKDACPIGLYGSGAGPAIGGGVTGAPAGGAEGAGPAIGGIFGTFGVENSRVGLEYASGAGDEAAMPAAGAVDAVFASVYRIGLK